jgi:hypothetical protein
MRSDVAQLWRLAKSAGLTQARLVGRNKAGKFDNYIWGGVIR